MSPARFSSRFSLVSFFKDVYHLYTISWVTWQKGMIQTVLANVFEGSCVGEVKKVTLWAQSCTWMRLSTKQWESSIFLNSSFILLLLYILLSNIGKKDWLLNILLPLSYKIWGEGGNQNSGWKVLYWIIAFTSLWHTLSLNAEWEGSAAPVKHHGVSCDLLILLSCIHAQLCQCLAFVRDKLGGVFVKVTGKL